MTGFIPAGEGGLYVQPIGSRRDTSTPRQWMPVDRLLAQVSAREEADERHALAADRYPLYSRTVPPLSDPHDPLARPARRGRHSRSGGRG